MEKFLLNNKISEQLYFDTASKLPIIDYHNHLCTLDVAKNKSFNNIYELWLQNDPYKHRAMRICGVDEEYITGSASPYKKFKMWGSVAEKLVGNPLYHWTKMELKEVFGIDSPLNKKTAEAIWEEANSKLLNLSAQDILKKFNVEYIAPCTSVVEDISVFGGINDFAAPSLRGDDCLAPDKNFIEKLESVTKKQISDIDSYIGALAQRIADFNSIGCRFSDHAVDSGFVYRKDENDAKKAFGEILMGGVPSDLSALQSVLLAKLCGIYADFGWTVQLHIGALRYTSNRLRRIAGPAGGYAAIENGFNINYIVSLLNDIEIEKGELPKIILFTLNPADNAAISVLSGSFSKNGVPAVISTGPAWWWCDHIQGIRAVLENISSFGVLSTFVGMTTDSRSILSFVRHDYFRRILCGWLGEKVESGEFPQDEELLKSIVADVCYENAKILIGEGKENGKF